MKSEEKVLFENYIRSCTVIKSKGKLHVVKIKNILYASSKGNYTTIFSLSHEPITVSKNLKKVLEQYFSSYPFIKVHQSHIINIEHLLGFSTKQDQKKELILSNQIKIPFSMSYLSISEGLVDLLKQD